VAVNRHLPDLLDGGSAWWVRRKRREALGDAVQPRQGLHLPRRKRPLLLTSLAASVGLGAIAIATLWALIGRRPAQP
jgi:hypothetical protein